MKWLNRILAPLAAITDEQAMWRVQRQDDHQAFAELVRRWERPIRRLCTRMTGDEHTGEDLAQETFARVFARRQAFVPSRKFSTWLWRIALNLCHDERRRRQRGCRPAPNMEPWETLPVLAEDPGPAQQLIEQERCQWVRAAILGLPETHRAVLVLREYEGLKLREIALALDIPEGTVKSRLADALTQLGKQLKPGLAEGHPSRVPPGDITLKRTLP